MRVVVGHTLNTIHRGREALSAHGASPNDTRPRKIARRGPWATALAVCPRHSRFQWGRVPQHLSPQRLCSGCRWGRLPHRLPRGASAATGSRRWTRAESPRETTRSQSAPFALFFGWLRRRSRVWGGRNRAGVGGVQTQCGGRRARPTLLCSGHAPSPAGGFSLHCLCSL